MSFSIRGHGLISDQLVSCPPQQGTSAEGRWVGGYEEKKSMENATKTCLIFLVSNHLILFHLESKYPLARPKIRKKKVEKCSSVKVSNLIQHDGLKCHS